jgi:hypothetical protein
MLFSTAAKNSFEDELCGGESSVCSFAGRGTFTFEIGAGIRLGGHGMEMAGMMVGLCLLAQKVARTLSGVRLPASYPSNEIKQ